MGNYEDRKVGKYKTDDVTISTCYVSDGVKSYETAVQHDSYNNGNWIIVENYDTKEEAADGHERWINVMSREDLPEVLEDCCNGLGGIPGLLPEDMRVFDRKEAKR